MRRLGPVAFGVLAAATVAAFFVTQHLKVSDPLISGYPHSSPPVIAPLSGGCGGRYRVTRLSFYLQHRADDVTVSLVGGSGGVVRTVVRRLHMPRNVRSLFTWDGRTDQGTIAKDGDYFWRVVLLGQGRTIQISGAVTVQDTPPRPRFISVTPHVLPPAGGSGVTIRFARSRAATVVVLYRTGAGPPRPVTRFRANGDGRALWNGLIHGRPAPAGRYLVGLAATDTVCNTASSPAQVRSAADFGAGAEVTVSAR